MAMIQTLSRVKILKNEGFLCVEEESDETRVRDQFGNEVRPH